MGFRRLPIYLPNFPLRLLPLSEAQQQIYEKTGFLRELAFKTIPSVNKIEIRRFLESIHGLKVEKVETINYEGKKKSNRNGTHRRTQFKKAYVTLKEQSS